VVWFDLNSIEKIKRKGIRNSKEKKENPIIGDLFSNAMR
jgi:hypothetical protein